MKLFPIMVATPPTLEHAIGTPKICASANEFGEFSIEDANTNALQLNNSFLISPADKAPKNLMLS